MEDICKWRGYIISVQENVARYTANYCYCCNSLSKKFEWRHWRELCGGQDVIIILSYLMLISSGFPRRKDDFFRPAIIRRFAVPRCILHIQFNRVSNIQIHPFNSVRSLSLPIRFSILCIWFHNVYYVFPNVMTSFVTSGVFFFLFNLDFNEWYDA